MLTRNLKRFASERCGNSKELHGQICVVTQSIGNYQGETITMPRVPVRLIAEKQFKQIAQMVVNGIRADPMRQRLNGVLESIKRLLIQHIQITETHSHHSAELVTLEREIDKVSFNQFNNLLGPCDTWLKFFMRHLPPLDTQTNSEGCFSAKVKSATWIVAGGTAYASGDSVDYLWVQRFDPASVSCEDKILISNNSDINNEDNLFRCLVGLVDEGDEAEVVNPWMEVTSRMIQWALGVMDRIEGMASGDSDAAHLWLSKMMGEFSLSGLSNLCDLPESHALKKVLAKHKGDLDLSCLVSLSDSAAKLLSKHRGVLDLSGLVSLSDSAAKSLAKHRGILDLSGLVSLSDSDAKLLAKHRGDLYLRGLTSLSDSAAKLLSKHRGVLDLSGLVSLSDSAAKVLAKHKGGLYLEHQTILSNAVAEALAKHEASFVEELASGDGGVVHQQLSEKMWKFSLSELSILYDLLGHYSLGKALAKDGGCLNLSNLTKLSDAAAKVLAKHYGDLNLSGLIVLGDSVAKALAKHKGGCLYLNRLTSLSDSAAEALTEHKGTLYLQGLTILSASSAKVLTKNKRRYLNLNRLTSLSDSAAEVLSKNKDPFYLRFITKSLINAIEAFEMQIAGIYHRVLMWFHNLHAVLTIRDRGFWLLFLDVLSFPAAVVDEAFCNLMCTLAGVPCNLLNAVAEALDSNLDGHLYLNGLKNLTDSAAKALAKRKGSLYLMGLESLSDAASEALVRREGVTHLNKRFSNILHQARQRLADKEWMPIRLKNQVLSQTLGGERKPGDLIEVALPQNQMMRFCFIPAGRFTMGSPAAECGRSKDEIQVEVTISKPFWLAKTEVTQAQWQVIIDDNRSRFKGLNRPVENVSWAGAQAYLTKLNEKMILPEGWKFALPTEAQWEYACRAGEESAYSGGNLDEVAWYDGNSRSITREVGKKKPNAWGLHDMHGNVEEWCADWYNDTLKGGTDPAGPLSGNSRVLRGGSWRRDASQCRAAYRFSDPPLNTRGMAIRHMGCIFAPDEPNDYMWYRSDFCDCSLGFRPALVPSR